MKKLLRLSALLLLLSGCAAQGPDMESVRQHYAGLDALELEAAATTVGEISLDFLLRFERAEEQDTVTILEPAGLSGITATRTAGGTSLSYQGAVAETLLPNVPGFSPCDVLSGLLDDLAAAIPASAAAWNTEEGEGLKLIYAGEQGEKQVWLGPDLGLVRAELYRSGSLMMKLEVR